MINVNRYSQRANPWRVSAHSCQGNILWECVMYLINLVISSVFGVTKKTIHFQIQFELQCMWNSRRYISLITEMTLHEHQRAALTYHTPYDRSAVGTLNYIRSHSRLSSSAAQSQTLGCNLQLGIRWNWTIYIIIQYKSGQRKKMHFKLHLIYVHLFLLPKTSQFFLYRNTLFCVR